MKSTKGDALLGLARFHKSRRPDVKIVDGSSLHQVARVSPVWVNKSRYAAGIIASTKPKFYNEIT
jgi:hypothetical protein